jgi:multiple sugar transport system permease protein
MAVIMARSFRGRSALRAAVLVPWAIPTAVTAKLWYFIFAFAGIANALFHTSILWTSDEWASRFAIIIADTWKTTPFMALLILAGLQLIPEEVYEAAKMDGANTFRTFTTITLPLVKPALMVAILFRILDALRMYDLPAILTGGGGGSGNATTTLSILVIKQVRSGYNSASALSTITFIIIFLVAFIFVRVLGTNVVRTQEAQQKGAK